MRRASVQKPAKSLSRLDFRAFLRPLLFALGFVYLGFHVMHGERGLYALIRESRHQEILKDEYQQVREQRVALELKVSHLRNDSLDLDLLDEQYRRMLGGVKKDEVVVLER